MDSELSISAFSNRFGDLTQILDSQVGGGHGLASSDEGTVGNFFTTHEIFHGVRHGSFETMGFNWSLVRITSSVLIPGIL